MTFFSENIIKGREGNTVTIGGFGELLTGIKHDDIKVSFQYGLNTEFDAKTTLTGDGTATATAGLLTVASSTGTAKVESKDTVRYRAGHTAYADFTASFVGTGTGYAGCFDTNNGFLLRVVNGVASFGYRKATVDTWQDITLPSGLDLTKLNIFRVMYGFLGVLDPILMVYLPNKGWQKLSQISTAGVLTTTHTITPNFPITTETSGAMSIGSGSWNAGTFGNGSVVGERSFCFAGSKTLSSTSLATVINFRNKSTYGGIANKVKAQLVAYQFYIDGIAGDGQIEFKIIKNATLSGTPSYTSIDTTNSIIEYDTTATYSSGGQSKMIRYIGYSSTAKGAGQQGDIEQADRLGLIAYPEDIFTITAQNVGTGSTSNVTVRVVFQWLELF
jgi:hypothetical protein